MNRTLSDLVGQLPVNDLDESAKREDGTQRGRKPPSRVADVLVQEVTHDAVRGEYRVWESSLLRDSDYVPSQCVRSIYHFLPQKIGQVHATTGGFLRFLQAGN